MSPETETDEHVRVVKQLHDAVLVVEMSSVFAILYVDHLENELFVEDQLSIGATSKKFELVFLHSIREVK